MYIAEYLPDSSIKRRVAISLFVNLVTSQALAVELAIRAALGQSAGAGPFRDLSTITRFFSPF